MGATKKHAVKKTQLSSAPDQVNQAPFNLKKHAFPLHLKYSEEGYHKILLSSLTKGSPLLTWSTKVA